MTNDNPADEKLGAAPHAMGDDGNLWTRNIDGSWHKHERPSTGDAEKDLLLQMPMPEFEAILKDDSHPSFSKAQELSVDLAQRIAWSLRPWGVVHPEVRKQFFGFLSDPNAAAWFLRHNQSSRRGFAEHFELSIPRFLMQGVDFARSAFDEDEESDTFESKVSEGEELENAGSIQAFEPMLESVARPVHEASVIAHVVGWEKHIEASTRLLVLFERLNDSHDQWRAEMKQSAEDAGKQAGQAMKVAEEANRLAKEANSTAQSKLIISVIALVASVVAALAALGSWIWG